MTKAQDVDTRTMIANELGEQGFEARQRIGTIVDALGEEAALELFARVTTIEEGGGMFARDGSRRSPGGVFFQLAREALPRDAKKRIFGTGKLGPDFRNQSTIPAPASRPSPTSARATPSRDRSTSGERPAQGLGSAASIALIELEAALAPLPPERQVEILHLLLSKRESSTPTKKSKRSPRR